MVSIIFVFQLLFTSWQVHVTQTVWVSPGIVHRAPHHCVLRPQPTEAPLDAGNAHTGPARGRSLSPHPPYHGSPKLETWPWKSSQCLERRQSSKSSWCQGRPLSSQRWVVSGGWLQHFHIEMPGPQRVQCLCSGHTQSHSQAGCHIVTVVHARLHLYQHIGFSQRVSQNWLRNPSSRRRRHCSWSWSPSRCRSCSFGPSPLHFHEKTEV